MKKILLIIILSAIAGGWYFFSGSGKDGAKGSPPSTIVTVALPEKQQIYDGVEAVGTAYAAESVDIAAVAAERITEILFTDGAFVKQGAVIVTLEQSEEQAQLAAVKEQMEEDERELARLQELLKDKAAAKRDYDEQLTRSKITAQAAAEIEARIADRVIRAPFDGILGLRRLSLGALVRAGDVIATIDDIHEIKMDFSVPSSFLPVLKQDTPVTATTDAAPGVIFHGKVESVDTRVDPVTRSVLIRALIPNPDHVLKPGLLMQVTLQNNPREAMVIPEESVLQKGEKHTVLVVGADDTVSEKSIETGTRRPGFVEVLKGLEPQDRVVTRGVTRVRAGQKVSVTAAE
jgi:membrane fusion protein, multidrug efflux system